MKREGNIILGGCAVVTVMFLVCVTLSVVLNAYAVKVVVDSFYTTWCPAFAKTVADMSYPQLLGCGLLVSMLNGSWSRVMIVRVLADIKSAVRKEERTPTELFGDVCVNMLMMFIPGLFTLAFAWFFRWLA